MPTTTSNTASKTTQFLFLGILVLHTLGCYIMGITVLFNPQFAIETGFQIAYNPEMVILSVVIGMELLFLGSVALVGIIWTRQGKREGILAGSAVGMYMFLFGFAALFFVGNTQGLLVDSTRGFITLVLGYLMLKGHPAPSKS
jgi:NO-binding membrane sensor protein with MHYT domain